MGEAYVRAENANLARFAPPHFSIAPAAQRGAVNEGAFLIFEEASGLSRRPSSFTGTEIEKILGRAIEYVARLRQSPSDASEEITDAGKIDAILIAERLSTFFGSEAASVVVRPKLPGCGWLSDAEGDVLTGSTLYEVKAGQRHFRLADLRQVLCYCALDFSSKRFGIREVSLVNPRAGTVIREDLESLCRKLSGAGSDDVLGEIINYVSEPLSRYQGS